MKNVVIGILVAVLLGVAILIQIRSRPASQPQTSDIQSHLLLGACYRVYFSADQEPKRIFLEAVAGHWVSGRFAPSPGASQSWVNLDRVAVLHRVDGGECAKE